MSAAEFPLVVLSGDSSAASTSRPDRERLWRFGSQGLCPAPRPTPYSPSHRAHLGPFLHGACRPEPSHAARPLLGFQTPAHLTPMAGGLRAGWRESGGRCAFDLTINKGPPREASSAAGATTKKQARKQARLGFLGGLWFLAVVSRGWGFCVVSDRNGPE